ncbi:iron ABC transporter permease [soil metagenome]
MFIKFIALIFFTIAIMLANLCLGDLTVAPPEALQAVFGQAGSSEIHDVIVGIRLPRLLTAFVVGLALATSGYLLQALSRNDLADPYLTGVSSGAAVGVACAMLLKFDFQSIPLFAFIGGITASFLVATIAKSGGQGISVAKLLLAGIALSSVAGALITLAMTTFGTQLMAQGLYLWLLGGISGRNWQELLPTVCYCSVGLIVALAAAKQLNLLALGEETASSLGLNVGRSQLIILSAAVLLASSAVALSGMVGFVGLVAPHLSRRLFGRGVRLQIICSGLTGAILVLFSDLLARTLSPGQELPLGTLMALIGGPFFIYLLSYSLDQVHSH